MKLDYGDRLLLAFERRRPLRCAVLMYCAVLGALTVAEDLVIGHPLPQRELKYLMPLAMLAPALSRYIGRRRKVIGPPSQTAVGPAVPDAR